MGRSGKLGIAVLRGLSFVTGVDGSGCLQTPNGV